MGSRTRILMIGGFLGAGKTTAIARLANHYQDRGQRVAVVTNDQAFGLVDTGSLRAQGLAVGEVPGACFCCKFDDLVDTMAELAADQRPDILLTEPVGSCTDLVATVVEPLRRLHGDRYEVGRLAVLCKPEHGRKILAGQPTGAGGSRGFSPKAAYIFLKQLEEADIVVVNKIDTLAEGEADELAALVERRAPGKTVLLASGKAGAGFDQLVEALDEPRGGTFSPMEVDYDIYAEGEAELAWLNAAVDLGAEQPFDLDRFAVLLVDQIATRSLSDGCEPAHIKVLGFAEERACVANRVSGDRPAELSLASGLRTRLGRMVINARVAGDPEVLAAAVERAVAESSAEHQIEAILVASQHFRPGRPEPTHRLV